MPNLAETYSLQCGLKIDRPVLYSKYFPITHLSPYVVFCNSSGMTAKNYDYWKDVIEILKPHLQTYQILQLGLDSDELINGCVDLRGKTTLNQMIYIAEHSEGVLCNDTALSHIGGHFNKPLVVVYGSTNPKCHGPHWFNKDKTILIESHRNGNKPSYARDENPKTINLIRPEEIAQKFLEAMSLQCDYDGKLVSRKSLYFGKNYHVKVAETIPNSLVTHPEILKNTLNIRADYHFDEKVIFQQATLGRVSIILDKIINTEILKQLKQNIVNIAFNLDGLDDINFVKRLQLTGITLVLLSDKKGKVLNDLKLKYLNFPMIQATDSKHSEDSELLDLKKKINEATIVKTNKMLFSNDKIFVSKAHWLANLPTEDGSGKIIDSMDFWKDLDYLYFYNN